MVGETPGAGRQAEGPRVCVVVTVHSGVFDGSPQQTDWTPLRRLGVWALLSTSALLTACASTADPPGGPPDQDPPRLVGVSPDSGAVLETPPREVEIVFDEVVSERIAAQRPEISGAVILSPDTGVARVGWHRNRLTVKPHGGFRPGRVYRIELLPVIVDLRQNRVKDGRLIVFSTGPALPAATLRGTVVDWPAARAGVNALIEAVLLPDSLPYRALTDSTGSFSVPALPAGSYLVYGTIDQDGNRRRGMREAYDTLRVTLGDTSTVELFAFVHDTTGPRIRTAGVVDSVTVRLVFDRPLDPTLAFDTTMVQVMPAEDTTQRLRVLLVATQRTLDSLRAGEAAARAAADTSRRQQQPVPGPPIAAPGAPGAPAAPAQGTPRDSTTAMRMLARRPAPTDTRLVRLAEPLTPESRYTIVVEGARSLSGIAATASAQLSVPRPRREATAGRGAPEDTTRAAADSTRAIRDTTRVRP